MRQGRHAFDLGEITMTLTEWTKPVALTLDKLPQSENHYRLMPVGFLLEWISRY